MSKFYHFIVSCIVTTFISIPLYSQYNAIGIDVPHGFTGKFKPSFERSIGKHFSVLINFESGRFASGTSGSLNSQTEVYSLDGKGWMPAIRVYPFTQKKVAPRGFFIGAYYRQMTFTEKYNDVVSSNNPFAPTTTVQVNIEAEAKSSNFGLSLGYKFSAGPIIIEPLLGFGSITYEWDNPTERQSIDPFFRSNLEDFAYTGRAELKFGFYFPQMDSYEEQLDNVPNQNMLQSQHTSDYQSTKENVKLFVYRPKKISGFAISYNVNVNDSISVHMDNGSYYLVELDSTSNYRISARTEENKVVNVTLEKGKVYYLRCKVGVGLFIGRPKFEFVDTNTGESEISYLKAKKKI